jgi:4-carboxymuconolactone decarboxylase
MSGEAEHPPPPGPSRLPDFDLEALDPEGRAVAEEVMRGRGRMPTPFRVWLAEPELARRMHLLGGFLAGGAVLGKAEAEIVILAAAHHFGADYVLATHGREALAAGLDPDAVADLVAGRRPAFADPRQAAVAELMEAVLASGTPSQEVLDVARSTVGPDGIAEALALSGYFTAIGLAMKLYAVEPPADEAGR